MLVSESDEFRGKFVFLKDGRLFIGNIALHAALLVMGKPEDIRSFNFDHVVEEYRDQVAYAGAYNGSVAKCAFVTKCADFEAKLLNKF